MSGVGVGRVAPVEGRQGVGPAALWQGRRSIDREFGGAGHADFGRPVHSADIADLAMRRAVAVGKLTPL